MEKNVNHHTVASYDLELANLKSDIIAMANLVKELLQISKKSIYEQSQELEERAYETDKQINALDNLVETRAISILALRQPMAIDLRKSLAALKMAVILERMGDILKNIASRGQNSGNYINEESQVMIENIFAINLEMLEKTITSYQNSDYQLANVVFLQDNEIDSIYSTLINSLKEQLKNNVNITESLVKVLFAAKNLERLGDYTTKLVSLISYIITGKKLSE